MRRRITYIWDRKLPHGWYRKCRKFVRLADRFISNNKSNNKLKMAGKATHRRRQVIIAAKRARMKKNLERTRNE